MNVFKDVVVQYKDQEYLIPENRVLMTIGKIEDILPINALLNVGDGALPLSKIARAYSVLINEAGGSVSADQVYAEFFSSTDNQDNAFKAMAGLQQIMLPPDDVLEELQSVTPKKKRQTKSKAKTK